MDFAKEQLSKYGWQEGEGLGKNKNGIKSAVRPKLKFDKGGLGHSQGDEYKFHWWEQVFDKAASNLCVENNSDGTAIVTTNGDELTISTKRKGKKRKKSSANSYGEFYKGCVLDGDNIKEINSPIDSDSDSDKEQFISDEKLFKICKGRTAHKGARHGLTLSGKLARLAQQENNFIKKNKT